MILEFHQRLSILAIDSVRALDRFPVRSEKDDICQTNRRALFYIINRERLGLALRINDIVQSSGHIVKILLNIARELPKI